MLRAVPGRIRRRHTIRGFAVFVALATLVGCSTKVDETNNGNPAPAAVITPIGAKATAGGGTSAVSITVRSGSAVILSGKDSDGLGVALAAFRFTQTAGPPLPAAPDVGAMLYQTANTVEFTAPQVSSDTVLTFQLTVTNALNVSSTATATVTVVAANDPNQFLISDVVDSASPPRRFVVALAPSQPLTLSSDNTVCVAVNRLLSYKSRDGHVHDGVQYPMLALPTLVNLQANATWRQAAGAAAPRSSSATDVATALQSTANPRVVFDVPSFNDVELAALYNQPAFDAAGNSVGISADNFNDQLVASDLDSVQLYVSISATAGSCDGKTTAPDFNLASAPLMLGVYTPTATTPALTYSGASPWKLSADSLAKTVSPTPLTTETLAGAQAYYAAIDPPWPGVSQGATKSDFNTWLDDNCFDHTQSDYGTGAAGVNGAHAIYTNNFDLGFGRDMYFIKCTADHVDANGNVTAHTGDMAAVVLNYGSLEQAALKQAAIIAVAMEYQGAGHSNGNCGSTDPAVNQCFTKFYIFAPDDRTGAYQRVSSANFDRRGEKYVPGACIGCHGGSIKDAGFVNPSPQTVPPKYLENVDAAFMPWDLDSLLNSDTDPAFNKSLTDGQPTILNPAAYTRAAQEPNLLKLNALAWQTWQAPEFIPTVSGGCASPPVASATCVDRFAAPQALLAKWYGWCPNGGAAGTSCAGSHPYTDTEAPTVIAGGKPWPSAALASAPANANGAPNDLYHDVFAHHCRSCHTMSAVFSDQFNDFGALQSFLNPVAHQPLGSKSLQRLLYLNGQMPLARLTMDRFWVDFNGGTASAAQLLGAYVNSNSDGTNNTPVGTDAGTSTVTPPGAPILIASLDSYVDPNPFEGISSAALAPASPQSAARFYGARADFSASLFVSNFETNLCLSPTADPSACTPAANQPVLVGADNATPAFDTPSTGYYNLTVNAVSPSGKTASAAASTYVVQVPQTLANVANCALTRNSVVAAASGLASTGTVIDLSGCPATKLGDSPFLQVQITDPSGTGSWFPAAPATPLATVAAPQTYTVSGPAVGTYYAVTVTSCSVVPPIATSQAPATLQGCNVQIAFAPGATSSQSVTIGYRVLDQVDTTPSPAAAPFAVNVSANYKAQSYVLPITLAPNYSGSAPLTTAICIPLAGAAPPAAPTTPSCASSGFLDGEISPPDDTFTLVVSSPSAFGSALTSGAITGYGSATLPLVASLASDQAVVFTVPAQGFSLGGNPTFVTCDIDGNDLQTGTTPCGGVNVPYSVQSTSLTGSPSCSAGLPNYLCNQFTITVTATTSFTTTKGSGIGGTSIYTLLNTNCSSCHNSVGTAQHAWVVTSGNTTATFNSITGGSCPAYTSGGTARACIKAGDPSLSQAYWNACGGSGTPRDAVNHPAAVISSATACNALSQWIAEGANLD
jgi:hypothetical protein